MPRSFQRAIEEEGLLSEPLTILNVGGHFSVGSRRVMEAEPDGQGFLVIHVALMGAQGMEAIDFGWSDFELVAQTGQVCNLPSVRADSEYQTLDDVMEAAASPDDVLAGINLGGVNNLTMVLLQNEKPDAKFRYVQVGGVRILSGPSWRKSASRCTKISTSHFGRCITQSGEVR